MPRTEKRSRTSPIFVLPFGLMFLISHCCVRALSFVRLMTVRTVLSFSNSKSFARTIELGLCPGLAPIGDRRAGLVNTAGRRWNAASKRSIVHRAMGTPPEQTDAPFAEAFAELKRVSGKSFRELAAEISEVDGRGLSPSYLSALAKGLERPAPRTMANLARALGKDAGYFAEYRLAQLRALLDEGGETGLDGALSVAREINSSLRDRAAHVDPAQYPHAVPLGCGPRMRPPRSRAAA